MTSHYTPRQILEHEHHASELLEHSEHKLLRLVPLFAAVLAVLAGLSSLYGGRLAERILTLKNDAVLHEVDASDLWSEYQAESLKANLYMVGAQTQSGARSAALRAQSARFRAEQVPLRAQARLNETQRDDALRASTATEKRKASFDVAVALYEISIVLISIVALTRRPWLLVPAGILGAIGVFFNLRAMSGPQ